jgi:hypothetical protein
MMKIVLLMKEYIGLNIYIYEVLFTHITTPCANTTCLRKQQATTNYQIFYEKIMFSLFPEMVFLENPMYTIQIIPYVK